ncbi:MAG: peptide-methionine (S)-S-oxide reductase [Alphaproteobacteria bacterium]|nr:MAG: peptide-methionine (S)-S-oxide reductase [Alphaproteobacteria bacterium]
MGALASGAASAPAAEKTETAIFAGGCFWCAESDFDKVPGVKETVSGYTGGHVDNPDYEIVSAGGSGHYESVKITFDPAIASYAELIDIFWHSVDPIDAGGQFCDRGDSYRTAIFTMNDEQQKIAEGAKAALDKSGMLPKPVATKIIPATAFYPAEDYHQNYYQKNPVRYKFYRFSCGRDRRVEELWGKDAHKGLTGEHS